MKAQKSPLILNDFLLINHNYHFIQPKQSDKINIPELTNKYSIDIDFVFNTIDKELFQLFTKINVNDLDKPLPGYILFIEGVCVFSFDNGNELSDTEKNNLLYVSGLNICINSLRNILATTTANGPFGKYILPSIDVNKLFIDKQSQISENKQNK